MSILVFLIPMALGLGLFFLMAFIWASKTGQFDDLETPAFKVPLEEWKPKPSTNKGE